MFNLFSNLRFFFQKTDLKRFLDDDVALKSVIYILR